jgi:hypothetical protein
LEGMGRRESPQRAVAPKEEEEEEEELTFSF